MKARLGQPCAGRKGGRGKGDPGMGRDGEGRGGKGGFVETSRGHPCIKSAYTIPTLYPHLGCLHGQPHVQRGVPRQYS